MAYDSAFGQLMHNIFGGFDMVIFSFFGMIQNDLFTIFAKFFSALGEPLFILFVAILCLVLFLFKNTRKIAFMILLAIFLCVVINNLFFKDVLSRMRPYNILQGNSEYFS